MNGEDDVDGGEDETPAERVQPAGDEERPEDGEEAVEDEAQPQEEHGEAAASDGEDGEEDQDEVGDLVVEVVERRPGGAEVVAVLQQSGPVLLVQPALQTGVGHRHCLAHLDTEIIIIMTLLLPTSASYLQH